MEITGLGLQKESGPRKLHNTLNTARLRGIPRSFVFASAQTIKTTDSRSSSKKLKDLAWEENSGSNM